MIVSRIQVLNTITAAILVIVNGKATHVITVGGAGRAIEPPFLVAELNDVVTFVFNGDFHSVTQSTLENPLIPLSGGFDGGPPIRGMDDSTPVRTWDLYITDALHRHTIWFFCKVPQKSSNCTEGVVGSINPQNQTMFDIFASAANQNPCTLNHTLTTSSSSAFIPTSVHEVSSVIPSSTQSSFANSTPTGTPSTTAIPGSGHRHRGAIIGGLIGGIFGLTLILLALFLCCWRRHSRSRDSHTSKSPFQAHKRKLDSNTFNVGSRGTPTPLASSEKHPPSRLNAGGTKIDILGSPSLGHIGGQPSQNQSQSQQKQTSANTVHTTLPGARFGQQADVVNGPSVMLRFSPDEPGPVSSAGPRKVDPAQHFDSTGPTAVLINSKSTNTPKFGENHTIFSPERQGPMFVEAVDEEEHGEIPFSTHRAPMGARLRQNVRAEEAHPEYGTVIGIDLGTSYARVGVQRGSVFEIIPNEEGQQATPSWVCFTGKKRLVGDFSKDFNPNNTVFSIKRLIGRKMYDLDIRDMKQFPFRVKEKNGAPSITVKVNGRERSFTPEEITAAIITKMKEIAETHLGYKITHAVLTVPACFNDAQRQATKDAGEIAGLNVVRILNEPTAAAIAHGLNKKGVSRVVVYDLGGGFFDVSLLAIDNGVFEVLATAGDTRLGGEDFDNRVVDYLVEVYKRKTGRDISGNVLALTKLKHEAEKAKRILSSEQSASIEIPSFENRNDFSETLTRAKFEELNIDLFNKTIKLVKKGLKDANCKKEEVNEILIVGGSTRIPRVQQLLNEFFSGKDPVREADSDNTTVHGAAIQGGILSGTGTDTNITLVDVCPHSRGIETIGGVFAILIPRNTAIPTKKSNIFTTPYDNQTSVNILVFEGEHPKTKHNNLLGSFELTGITPAPRLVPQIDVTFETDANGITQVRASDLGTGNSKAIRIVTNKGRLTQEEIMRMQTEDFIERD